MSLTKSDIGEANHEEDLSCTLRSMFALLVGDPTAASPVPAYLDRSFAPSFTLLGTVDSS